MSSTFTTSRELTPSLIESMRARGYKLYKLPCGWAINPYPYTYLETIVCCPWNDDYIYKYEYTTEQQKKLDNQKHPATATTTSKDRAHRSKRASKRTKGH